MMSSVSVVTEACGAGSLETIHGWNMPNGFLGKCRNRNQMCNPQYYML